MASRPLIKPYPVVSTASMADDVITPPTNVSQISLVGYTLAWTGTPTGSFTIEVCNDAQFDPNGAYIANTGSWDTLTLSTTVSASGSDGTAFIALASLPAAFVRMHYIASSGAGSLTVTVNGKVA